MPEHAAGEVPAVPVEVLALPALDDTAVGWRDITLPDSAPPTRLLRLHLDRPTSATVSLVRFPAGWARPGRGHYVTGEEFVVLAGSLRVSGAWHRAGDAVYLPPRVPREDSASPEGALALAWFSGVPQWHPTPDGCVPAGGGYAGAPAPGTRRAPAADVPGSSEVVAAVAPDPAGVDRDITWFADGSWAFVPADTAAPALPGPALVRTWPGSE